MKPILIGSRALAYWDKSFKLREDADWDIISSEPIEGAEFHDVNFLNNYEIDRYCVDVDYYFNGIKLRIVTLEGLRLIKRSHLWRDWNFQKHMCHYQKHIMPCLAKTNSYSSDYALYDKLLAERTALTMEAFPQANPKLNVSKGEFFDDYVVKKYDHDLLHEIVSYYPKPIYMMMQSNDGKVWCDRNKWNQFSHTQKQQCITEEAYVIAAERFLIPRNWVGSKKISFNWAMNKICTTLTSGWFRDYAIDYYGTILNRVYNEEHLIKLERTLKLIGE